MEAPEQDRRGDQRAYRRSDHEPARQALAVVPGQFLCRRRRPFRLDVIAEAANQLHEVFFADPVRVIRDSGARGREVHVRGLDALQLREAALDPRCAVRARHPGYRKLGLLHGPAARRTFTLPYPRTPILPRVLIPRRGR